MLRPERKQDEAAVRVVHHRAFGDHGQMVGRLVDELRRAGGATSLVATGGTDEAGGDGTVVGHVMLSPALLDAPRRLVPVQVLSPLAVDPAAQHRGVGASLVRAALTAADQRGAPLVVLEGSPRYYPRLGFRPGASLGLRRPSLRIPPEAFHAVLLGTHEPWMTGTVVYPDVFWRLDAVGLRDEPSQPGPAGVRPVPPPVPG